MTEACETILVRAWRPITKKIRGKKKLLQRSVIQLRHVNNYSPKHGKRMLFLLSTASHRQLPLVPRVEEEKSAERGIQWQNFPIPLRELETKRERKAASLAWESPDEAGDVD